MSDFDLYYWPLPFRGQFIRAILAYGGCSWDEHGPATITEMMARNIQQQPVAFMGPPVLFDRQRDFALAQMPAIASYLGGRLSLLHDTIAGQAETAKIVNDANDVIDELTRYGGSQMWSPEAWNAFVPRLQKWLHIFQDTGTRHGMTADKGFILGTSHPGIADITTATLWNTMADRFGSIKVIIEQTTPILNGLCRRLATIPALAKLNSDSWNRYGESYCGGEIEKSLRRVAR